MTPRQKAEALDWLCRQLDLLPTGCPRGLKDDDRRERWSRSGPDAWAESRISSLEKAAVVCKPWAFRQMRFHHQRAQAGEQVRSCGPGQVSSSIEWDAAIAIARAAVSMRDRWPLAAGVERVGGAGPRHAR